MGTNIVTSEVRHDFPGFFKVYKDGGIERYLNTKQVPAGQDPETGVQSKDVVISPEFEIKARVFLPQVEGPTQKLPLLIHYHGGAFCTGSAFASAVKRFLSNLAAKANLIAISIDYRLAPEHKLPIAYQDSCAGLLWVAKHVDGLGPEPWINEFADLDRVILAGESAGGTLAHYVAVQASVMELVGLNISKLLVIHPYLGSKKPNPLYIYMCPTSSGSDDDPKIHPRSDPNTSKLKCEKILVCVAEKDMLKNRGVSYYETMKNCGWGGDIELYETLGEDHVFHFFNRKSENVGPFIQKLVDFLKLN